MRQKLLVLFFLLLIKGCSKYREHKQLSAIAECKKTWQYFKLHKPIKGVVLAHIKGYCGYIYLSANSLIITSAHDTIRVIEPCDNEILATTDSVLITPAKEYMGDGTVSDLKYECKIKRTCYGVVTTIKK